MKDEASLQRACVKYFMIQKPDWIIAAIPNGGSRHPWEAYQMRLQGVKAGMPDLVIVQPEGRVTWVELKAEKGKVSERQQEIHYKLGKLHHLIYVIRNIDQFIQLVTNL